MDPFQVVQAHFLANNADLTGVLPVGTDSEQTKLRGRYRKWTACTNGGLFQQPVAATVHASMSGLVRCVMWNLPGVTSILFSVVDMDGLETVFWTPTGVASTARGFWDPQQQPLILPGGAFKVSGTGKLTAAGSIVVYWDDGLEQDLFKEIASAGTELRPPPIA